MKHKPATPPTPKALEMFQLKRHTRLTDAVIARVACEIKDGTPADMAIALRNHAYAMEQDRARLISALSSLLDEYAKRTWTDPVTGKPAAARALLRELGEIE